MTKLQRATTGLLILLALLAAGCPMAKRAPVPARGFLVRNEQPESGLGAYGYLLFITEPTAQSRARYEHVCESFKRSLRDEDEYAGQARGQIMLTYWLLNRPYADARAQSCAQLVDNYDYASAAQLASAVNKLGAAGPVLAAWRKPYGSEEQGQSEALVLDMSNFSDEDFDRAFGIWKERIVMDPSVWNSGFNYVKAREAFRNLISKYGEQIVAIIKPK